jgi:hypothetical protein
MKTNTGDHLNEFVYEKGPLVFTHKPLLPNMVLFDVWLEDFFALQGVHNYKVWLSGGFLAQQWRTYDIDITLVGPLQNLEELAHIMIEGTRIGFEKYQMLFDIQHHNVAPLEKYTQKTQRQIIEKIVFADKVIVNGNIVTDWTDGEKISEHLWKVKRIMPSDKQMAKMTERKYKKPICLNEGNFSNNR